MVDAVKYRSANPSKEAFISFTPPWGLAEWLMRDDLSEYVDEDIRHSIIIAFLRLLENGGSESLTFPSSFSATERAFAHVIAKFLGLRAQSFGSGQRRFLTVSRVTSPEATLHKIRLLLTWNSRRAISQLLQSNPLTSKERLELHPRTDGSTVLDRGTREERQRGTTGRLMGAVPQIPPAPVNMEGSSCSGNPSAVFAYRNHIIRSLDANPILIVFGPPGSGKTTYLPQILMDNCHDRSLRCRMICTQPRRLYAHINAERLAQLRGETVGQTIGYQIRLESKVSPRTLLTFCTHGVLLRTIYADPGLMSGTTHILVDEIEEDELPPTFAQTHSVYVTGDTRPFVRNSTTVSDTHHRNLPSDAGHSTNPNNGCGILLGLLPSLLVQYPHLKVILLVNLRKTSYDMWTSRSVNSFLNADFPRVNRSPTTGDNGIRLDCAPSFDASRYTRMVMPPDPTTQFHQLGIEEKCTSAFQSFDGQGAHGRAVCDVTSFSACAQNPLCEHPAFSSENRDQGARSIESGNFASPVQSPASASNACPSEVCWMEQNKADLFNAFYNHASVVMIPFSEQTIKVYHLGEVLQWLNFWNPAMEEASSVLWQDEMRCQVLYHWLTTDHLIQLTSQLSAGDRESWSGGRSNELTSLHEMNSCNLQWSDNGVCFEGDVTKPVPFSSATIDYKTSPHLKEVATGVMPSLNTTFTSNSRQHANNLLWSIWRDTVLSRGSTRTRQREKYPQNSNIAREIQALITNLHQCILAGWFPVDYQHSQSGLTALMVCAAAGLIDSVDRLLGFGADVFLRVPMPYEILQSRTRGSLESDQKLMGLKHRRIRIGDETYIMVGVNAHDLARLFGHRQVASILAKHMAAHSLRHVPENWEAALYRFGSWFDGPVSSSPFNQCLPTGDCSQAASGTNMENVAKTVESQLGVADQDNTVLTTYLVARNGITPETAVDFDLLVILLTKLDLCVPEGMPNQMLFLW
ncbi:putative ATP-dependent RNA helicase YTHDC2 [Fasciola hepatica]|uniref:ATP-dependent RNA helicase YTHDC2 n=1 Tax=Fasciola hepatica TaxID=6192 RepID=A0A4E0RUV9_FASHE|nr:putative ATP-dependent RNA helicase YTHDC2 [Fasciola hepatica]